MSLFTELTDEVLEQDPNLSLECFLSARRYIQVRWRALHGTPMPEDAPVTTAIFIVYSSIRYCIYFQSPRRSSRD